MTAATRTGGAGVAQRNLERNRAAVAEAALTLFAERGFDAVTVDEIAEAAGISRRTFFRYFASKEDALLPDETDRLEELREALASRPAGEPVLATIRRVTLAAAEGPTAMDRSDTLARLRVIDASPSVNARRLELQRRWEDAITELVAEHLGDDPATSVTARVVAGASVAAARAALDVWLATGGERDLAGLLEEAFAVLTGGIDVRAGAGRPPRRQARRSPGSPYRQGWGAASTLT